MSFSGPKIFQSAIAFEAFANIASLPVLFFKPDLALSYLLEDPSRIPPSYRQASAWFGVFVTLVTVPLVRSYPNPAPGSAGDAQRKYRFATYIALGGFEVVIAALSVLLPSWNVDTGFSKAGLRSILLVMSAILTLRYFFLVVNPSWMYTTKDTGKQQ